MYSTQVKLSPVVSLDLSIVRTRSNHCPRLTSQLSSSMSSSLQATALGIKQSELPISQEKRPEGHTRCQKLERGSKSALRKVSSPIHRYIYKIRDAFSSEKEFKESARALSTSSQLTPLHTLVRKNSSTSNHHARLSSRKSFSVSTSSSSGGGPRRSSTPEPISCHVTRIQRHGSQRPMGLCRTNSDNSHLSNRSMHVPIVTATSVSSTIAESADENASRRKGSKSSEASYISDASSTTALKRHIQAQDRRANLRVRTNLDSWRYSNTRKRRASSVPVSPTNMTSMTISPCSRSFAATPSPTSPTESEYESRKSCMRGPRTRAEEEMLLASPTATITPSPTSSVSLPSGCHSRTLSCPTSTRRTSVASGSTSNTKRVVNLTYADGNVDVNEIELCGAGVRRGSSVVVVFGDGIDEIIPSK